MKFYSYFDDKTQFSQFFSFPLSRHFTEFNFVHYSLLMSCPFQNKLPMRFVPGIRLIIDIFGGGWIIESMLARINHRFLYSDS